MFDTLPSASRFGRAVCAQTDHAARRGRLGLASQSARLSCGPACSIYGTGGGGPVGLPVKFPEMTALAIVAPWSRSAVSTSRGYVGVSVLV